MLTIQLITNIIYYLLKAARRLRRGRPDDNSDEPDDPDTDDEPPPGDMPISILEGGEWWGTGAEMLGLSGPITNPKHLEALFKGYGLDGKPLVQNAGSPKRQAGWDCNSAAPKEFSILVSAVDHPTREALISVMVRAKKDGDLQYLTDVAIYTRRGKGGKILERARPVFALFPELTSDALQPHAHCHGALINCAGREDLTWGTIFSKPFYLHKLTAGALFQAELGYLLKTEFGLELEPTKYGFRIKRVPKKLVDFYSARHKEIQSKVGPNASARAADAAAQITRKGSPENPPTLDELLIDWQEINDAHGFTQAKAMGLFRRAKVPTEPPELKSDIEKAIKGLLDQENRFSEQQLIREVARAVAAKGVQAKEIIRQVREHLLNTPDVLPLPALKYEPLYTTKEVLAQEQELLAAIAEGKGDKSHVIPDEIIERVLDKYLPIHEGLTNDEFFRNREQRNAAQQIATQTGWISVMEGFAGAGKGYVAKVLAEIFSKAGLEPIGMAPSAVAAGNFQDSTGIDSDTIAMWLVLLDRKRDYKFHLIRQAKRFIRLKRNYAYRGRQKRLTKKSVVFVDEAAMVGTERMLEIVRQVRKAGAKLILIGDRTQLQPIDRGGPFHSIAEQTHVATLSHVVQQKPHAYDPEPDWHKNAAILIRNGHGEAAIKKYAERGRLTITKTRDEAILSAARDWSVVAIADKERKKKIIILAGLREDVNALNDTCQSSMSQAGFLFGEPVQIGERGFFVGDTVLFTKNSRALAVKNGDRGVILSVNRQKKLASIRLHRTGKPVIIPYRTYQHLDLGYAMTTYKAQGLTVDEAFVLLGGSLQDRHLSYVQMTRAADSTRLYVDKLHAGPKLRDIIGQIERERPKLMLDAVVSPEWFQKNLADELASETDEASEEEGDGEDAPKPKKLEQAPRKAKPRKPSEAEKPKRESAGTGDQAQPIARLITSSTSEAVPPARAVPTPTPCHSEGQRPSGPVRDEASTIARSSIAQGNEVPQPLASQTHAKPDAAASSQPFYSTTQSSDHADIPTNPSSRPNLSSAAHTPEGDNSARYVREPQPSNISNRYAAPPSAYTAPEPSSRESTPIAKPIASQQGASVTPPPSHASSSAAERSEVRLPAAALQANTPHPGSENYSQQKSQDAQKEAIPTAGARHGQANPQREAIPSHSLPSAIEVPRQASRARQPAFTSVDRSA